MSEGTGPVPDAPGRLGRPFWTLLGASAGSNLADGLLKTVLPLVAVTVTRDPVPVAAVSTLLSLPWLVLALPAGAYVDRWDRRATMVVANLVRATAAAGLAAAAVAGAVTMPLLWGMALVVGVAEVFADTASQTILPQLVVPGLLPRANARLYGVEVTANQFVGPPLGGFLVAAGTGLALGVPGAAWLLGVGLLVTVPGRFRVERAVRTTLRRDVAEGLRFLLHHRTLRTLAVMTGLFNLAGAVVSAVFVLYAVGPASAMRLSERQYGVLLTATAVGSLLGSLVAERIERRLGRLTALGVAVLTGLLGTGALVVTANPWVIGGLWVVEGVFIMVWNVVVVTLRQSLAPAELLGRLNSAYRLLAWGSLPVGAALGGVLADAIGLRSTFAVAAGLVAVVAGLLPALRSAGVDPPGS